MGTYIIRRVLLMVPTLLVLSLIIFGLMRVLPGDVAMMILTGGGADAGVDEKSLIALREQMGLDRPMYVQYSVWLWDIVRGNFGESLYSHTGVMGEILQRLPITFQIALMAQMLSLLIGIPVGTLSAIRQNSWLDFTLRFWSIFFLAAPTFWLGLMVILGGTYWFNWIPPIGHHPIWEGPRENILQLMWPTMILASHGLATTARMTRSTMLEVMREDYIRTARAKGLGEQVVIIRHALKNALIPVITLSGLTFASLLGGAVILEYIFGIPGLGSYFITAIRQYDYPVAQGLTVVFATLFMSVNLLVDLLYGWLDPRISYS